MTQAETLTALMQARFSCRAFRPDPVPRSAIESVLNTARHTPSWCNAQPWGVVLTSGPATDGFRTALYEHATSGAKTTPDLESPKSYPGIYGERRRICGWQLYGAVGVTKGDRTASTKQAAENFNLFGAPHVALIHSPKELGPYGALDCGGFITAFCLAAQAHGIATVPQAAIAFHSEFVKDWFGIGDDRLLIAGVSFGYGDESHPANSFRTARAPLDEFVDWREA